jgi:hypothetical protein
MLQIRKRLPSGMCFAHLGIDSKEKVNTKRGKGKAMEQNCAVAITVVFIFVVMGLAFLLPSGWGGRKRSKESNHDGR